ncbi:hypothetical protein [Methylobacterium thuringiense]|nr:hypothetical protein [Methylobacterium thuringiense]
MASVDPDLPRIRILRRSIADRIEADIALLDALAGDPDLEDGWDDEDGHDSEGGTDDNGVADFNGIGEQGFCGYPGSL